jgi:hypothetical protein
MAEWSRVVNTTTHDWLRGEEVNVLRNRKLLALMKEKGRISFNHFGDAVNWKVQYKQVPLQGAADGDTLTFPRRDRWKSAQLDWRGYASTDSMTKKERLMNRSTAQLVDMYADIAKLLMQDMKTQFGQEFYVDGYASGNEKRLHGIESFMGGSVAQTNQPIELPSKSYAGLNTDLGSYGGNWTGNWPDGLGDAHYDFWSPLQIDYTNTLAAASGGWQSSTQTWPNVCTEALNYGIIYTQKNRTMEEKLDVVLLDVLLYRQFKDAMRVKERIEVQRNGAESKLVKLGFEDTLNMDGCDITSEYGIPANTGYGFNVDMMELRSMQGQMFVPNGPEYNQGTMSWRFVIDFWGNLCFNPRYFVKFFNYGLT